MKKILKKLMIVTVMTLLCMAVALTADATTCDHDWRPDYRDGAYSCPEGGDVVYWCTNCKASKYEYAGPIGSHDWEDHPTDEELATYCGTREYWIECRNCNYWESLYLAGTAEHEWYSYPTDEELATHCGTRDYWVECRNCSHGEYLYLAGTAEHRWERDYEEDFDCEKGGVVGFWCSPCDSYKEEYIAPDSHIVEWHSNGDATCTEDGTKYSYCSRRGCDAGYIETVTDVGSALGHDYHEKWTVLTTATCTYPGISVRACKRCADIESSTEAPYGHYDEDEDGKCDECKVIIQIYAPNDPSIPSEPGIPDYPGEPDDSHEHTYGEWTEKDGVKYRVCTGCGNVETEEIESTPDTPEKDDCSCNCHKSGFMGFIWKILNFFYKLFKMNPVCKCGIAHY